MAKKPFSVGQSKVNTWRNCRRQYHYKYVLELQRRRTRRPFMFGKIIHRMVEAKAEGEDPMALLSTIALENEEMFAAEREMYGEIIHDIGIIMRDYFDYWSPKAMPTSKDVYRGTTLRLLPVENGDEDVRYTEHEFAIDLGDGIVWKGQIDGLGKTSDKLIWLVERKSFDKLPGDDHRWRNLQTVTYARAAVMLGWVESVDGVCWDYVKSKPPTEPQLLKKGDRLSVKDIVTLPSVVLAAIKRHGLSVEAHAELLERAHASRDEYFQRIFTPINSTTADNIFAGFVESAREMRDNHGRKKDMNLGRHCEWCDYEPLCRAELTGGDVDYLKQMEYTNEDPEAYRRNSRDAATNKPAGGTAREEARGKRSPKLRTVR